MSSTLFLVSLDDTLEKMMGQLITRVHSLRGGEDDGFVEQQSARVEQGQWTEFLSEILNSTKYLLKAPKADAISFLTIAFDFLSRVSPDDRKQLVEKACAELTNPDIKFTGDDSDGPTLRIQMLSDLYNLKSIKKEYPVRCHVLCCLVQYAADTDNLDYLYIFLINIDAILKQWGVGVAEKRQIYKLLGSVLPSIEGQSFTIKYLQTFNDSSTEELATVKTEACKVIAGIFEASLTQGCSTLFAIKAIEQLKTDKEPAYANLYQLLQIFASGDLAGYQKFYAENKGLIEAHGIDNEKATRSMRLLALHRLALSKKDGMLKYTSIAEALQIDIDDVETWVIAAMSKKQQLLDARMDQARQIVVVSSCVERHFGDGQWLKIQRLLHAWKDNLSKHLTLTL